MFRENKTGRTSREGKSGLFFQRQFYTGILYYEKCNPKRLLWEYIKYKKYRLDGFLSRGQKTPWVVFFTVFHSMAKARKNQKKTIARP
jgi:hypothetical protein